MISDQGFSVPQFPHLHKQGVKAHPALTLHEPSSQEEKQLSPMSICQPQLVTAETESVVSRAAKRRLGLNSGLSPACSLTAGKFLYLCEAQFSHQRQGTCSTCLSGLLQGLKGARRRGARARPALRKQALCDAVRSPAATSFPPSQDTALAVPEGP